MDTRAAATSARGSKTFERSARAGYAVSGVLHLLLAWIVLRLAFGAAGNADQSGAFATLSEQTGGAVMLWLAAAGLTALGLWHLVEAVAERDVKDRVEATATGGVHLALAASAATFAVGSGRASNSQNAGWSARLMQSGWGSAVLVIVALVLIGVGGYHVYKGATKGFVDELDSSGGTAILAVGVLGYVAKGLALAGAGVLVIVATVNSDPAKASGVDAAVKTLGAAPYGRVLLVLAALGLASFGIYSFVRSRHAEM